MNLNKSGLGVAVLASVSLKAVAQTTGVVASATAAALVRVVVGSLSLSDVGLQVAGLVLETETGQLGGASSLAQQVLHHEQVLGALHGISGEHHLDVGLTLHGGVVGGSNDGKIGGS